MHAFPYEHLGLLLGTESPVTMPNSVGFSFPGSFLAFFPYGLTFSKQCCLTLTLQESEIDADSIRSRFRFLIPIMLGACHVMACVLWYVGTYNLPLTNGMCSPPDTDSDTVNPDPTCQDYDDRLSRHWLSGYSGDYCTRSN